jgi:chromosome segregation ATPase
MEPFDQQLQRLQMELEKSEAAITQANTDLLAAQNDVKQFTTVKTAVQRAIEEITLGQVAIDKQRQAAAKELEDAKKTCAEIRDRLEGLLSQEYRDSITAAIKFVDDEISAQLKKASDLKQQAADTTQVLNTAKEEAASCEASLRAIQNELNTLPTRMASAQSRVVKLKADAQKAADTGPASEAYVLAADLNQALTELEELTAAKKEIDLRNNLIQRRAELDRWNEAAGKAAADLDQLKRDQAAAEQQYQAKLREREEAIKKKLAEEPKETVRPK